MRCKNCNAELDGPKKFCPHCGTRLEVVDTSEPREPGTGNGQVVINSNNLGHPMKWHNFLMVVMIIGGILSIINGITTISGTEYRMQGLDSRYLYSRFPGLQTADITYGVATIMIGIFQFVVRNRLHDFRENGPRMLTILYIVTIVAQFLYSSFASSAIGVNMFSSPSTIGYLVSPIISLIINSIYYSHRRDLFVN